MKCVMLFISIFISCHSQKSPQQKMLDEINKQRQAIGLSDTSILVTDTITRQ